MSNRRKVASTSPENKEQQAKVQIADCPHSTVQCTFCKRIGTAAQLIASRKRGPRSRESAAQSRAAAKLGGYPSGRKRVEMSLADASKILANKEGDGIVIYGGVKFERSKAEASEYAAQRGGRTGITVTGAMLYIRSTLKKLGMAPSKRDWGRIRRGEMSIDQVVAVLVSVGGPDVATYRGVEISKASVIAYSEEIGKDISERVAKDYIRSLMITAKEGEGEV